MFELILKKYAEPSKKLMEKEEEVNNIDIKKYRKFNRKLPWNLIVKIVVVIFAIGLLYYFRSITNKVEKLDDFEINISE